MSESPYALLLGEGEIDRVQRMLEEQGVDLERTRSPNTEMETQLPRGVLIVSGHCLSSMPVFVDEGGEDPLRVCIHTQDFLPLRARLREYGFHYLVQSALDDTSLRVFLTQILHSGASQRRSHRLPLGGRVEYRSVASSGVAHLADLSAEGCRILGAPDLSLEEAVTVLLPRSLGAGKPLALQGHVIRAQAEGAGGGGGDRSVVVRFSVLEEETRKRLDRLVRGELIGARVTPLAEPPVIGAAPPRPKPDPEPVMETPQESVADRRREVRHPFRGRVDVLEVPAGIDGVLARDLSLDGVRISSGDGLKPGMKVTLALFGGRRPQPVVVEAEAIRVAPDEAALIFGQLSAGLQEKLAALIAEEPALECLDPGSTQRVVATQILSRDGE